MTRAPMTAEIEACIHAIASRDATIADLRAQVAAANAEAARRERVAVVAWLRGPHSLRVGLAGIAEAIERGEHRREETK